MARPKKTDLAATQTPPRATAQPTNAEISRQEAKSASKLDAARAAIEKVWKKSQTGSPIVPLDDNGLLISLPHISTGSLILDNLIGGRPNANGVRPCPGLPRGMISNVYGAESSGKTTFALETAASVCAQGGSVVYIDWENAIVPLYAAALGVPVTNEKKFCLVQPETFEQGLKVAWTFVNAGVDLLVFDSVGAGVPEAIFKQSIEEQGEIGRLGLVAQIWGAFLPKMQGAAKRTGTHIMGISQLRKKIATGPMAKHGPDTQAQGGEAWKFYSAVRMMFRKVGTIKGKRYDIVTAGTVETPTANLVNVKLDKCKVAPNQGAEGTIYIEYGKGFSNIRSYIDIAKAHKIIKAGGAWIEWSIEGQETRKIQGVEAFVVLLEANPDLEELLVSQVRRILEGGADPLEAAPVAEFDDDEPEDFDSIMSGITLKPSADEDDL